MKEIGELCLLMAFVGSGFAAFVYLSQSGRQHLWRVAGAAAALLSVLALTLVTGILAWALYSKDFSFKYVANYSDSLLPWYYSLSALWVGQSGSLLLWAWFLSLLIVLLRWGPGRRVTELHDPAWGVLLAVLCFLLAVMVFAADPMEANVSLVGNGVGLSPLLQHPAMLIHPPIIFLGYALWTVPFALAASALITGQLDASWIQQARTWSLTAWAVLGVGILLGAQWAYVELGWGGYWAWDPVENGSLLPWLTGTVLIHSMMTWQHQRMLKKTTIMLAFLTFGLSNFATFLTRSGVFSSLHAFSQSPIGWLFLGLMLVTGLSGIVMLYVRWPDLSAERTFASVMSREAGVVIGAIALLLLASVVIGGTLSSAVSAAVAGNAMLVGPDFYNNVMIPTGLVLLLVTAAAPLLRWGAAPSREQWCGLLLSGCAGIVVMGVAAAAGISHPLGLVVAGFASFALFSLISSVVVEARRQVPRPLWIGCLSILVLQRRQYAGFLVHLGFVCLAVGIAGSSLGKRERGFVLVEGEQVQWAGREIHLVGMHERELPDKLVAEAELRVTDERGRVVDLRPAQHFHRLQEQWTTEVDIHATWQGDFYAILHSGDLDGKLYLTFVENPLMSWIWLGGAVAVLGTLVRVWPSRRRRRQAARLGVGADPRNSSRCPTRAGRAAA